MSNSDSTGLQDSGLAEQDAKEAGVFGVDAKGRKHRWHRGTATIVVTNDGEIVHTEELAREHVPQWIDHVTENVDDGWVDVWWSVESPAEAFGRSQDAYQTADELVCDGGQER